MNKTQVTFRIDSEVYKAYKMWCLIAGTTPTSDLNRYIKNLISTNPKINSDYETKVISKAEWDSLFIRLRNMEGEINDE